MFSLTAISYSIVSHLKYPQESKELALRNMRIFAKKGRQREEIGLKIAVIPTLYFYNIAKCHGCYRGYFFGRIH